MSISLTIMLNLTIAKVLVVIFPSLLFGFFALSVAGGLTFMEFWHGYSFKIVWFSDFLDGGNENSK